MGTTFEQLSEPTEAIAEAYHRWENDPDLIPMIRPNKDKEALESRHQVSVESLRQRLEHHEIYLVFADGELVGEANFMVNPGHLYSKRQHSAWIGISIGEPAGRGRGIGFEAMRYLEERIKERGIKRVELGVFEFNEHAHRLYRKLGYKEMARIPDFTYWNGQMWADIRMEKFL
ncbi:Protein N-acetyltransferase, RimJ/RimL family [Halobacillus karajensis]|uniref:Acetyltransferase n=1 Tax=Halobacillus karajensis TaxID=195088 RepID=A0A024P7B6_9BACI|nr:GNAT family N-acetyltransferase [Halobacillus karajensis]CDQ20305.1 putative acetyltransferase [Halobacillus karajensis]CDQ25034.1 putative acetyltransferase [Halobacillus karajensis]CDQ28605.1 putative acetyltransferase [Halobacillus karajensis]SEI11743.1 Protein N-acetyltransferase, RimJ/RimL family [Halobacillus karajensis]